MAETVYTKWHKELDIFHKVKSVIIMEGNIMDKYQYTDGSDMDITYYLYNYFKEVGYQTVVGYDAIEGFYDPEEGETESLESFTRIVGKSQGDIEDARLAADFFGSGDTAPILVRRAMVQQNSDEKNSCAIIMNMASRYISSPDNLSQEEVDSFTTLLLAANQSASVALNDYYAKNILVLIVNKTNDIPAWFCMDNPHVKILYLSTPGIDERTTLIKNNFSSFFDPEIYQAEIGYYNDNPVELEKIQDKFIGLTEGFTFREISDLRLLCKNEKIHLAKMSEVVDLYRYGPKENPWTRDNLRETLKEGEARIRGRVKGQDVAVEKTLNVVKRAAAGMSGLQHSSHTKPKGILFFAGPTGTGKTEMAKTLAELLFGDENRCIRFDMSEYSAPQSDQKLLGAPPGYVGYEAGGQLTNAVRENPFSILLFDEIEKAHGSIFDKFLQILEDGRMTDGQGKTVYFSESIIIFTSNLGIYKTDEYGHKELNVSSKDDYEDVADKVKSAIEGYFKLELGRPEILNRIGENIVVFDFIRPEVAKLILEGQVKKIISNLRSDKNIELSLSDKAMETLLNKANTNLDNGGRGIGNVVEDVLINPLSKYLFDEEFLSDAKIDIQDFVINENGTVTMDVSGERL